MSPGRFRESNFTRNPAQKNSRNSSGSRTGWWWATRLPAKPCGRKRTDNLDSQNLEADGFWHSSGSHWTFGSDQARGSRSYPCGDPRTAHLLPLVLAEAAAVRLALKLFQERVHGSVIRRVRLRTLHCHSRLQRLSQGTEKRTAPSGGRVPFPLLSGLRTGRASQVPLIWGVACLGVWPGRELLLLSLLQGQSLPGYQSPGSR